MLCSERAAQLKRSRGTATIVTSGSAIRWLHVTNRHATTRSGQTPPGTSPGKELRSPCKNYPAPDGSTCCQSLRRNEVLLPRHVTCTHERREDGAMTKSASFLLVGLLLIAPVGVTAQPRGLEMFPPDH